MKSILDINYHQKANGNVYARQLCREFQALQLWFLFRNSKYFADLHLYFNFESIFQYCPMEPMGPMGPIWAHGAHRSMDPPIHVLWIPSK